MILTVLLVLVIAAFAAVVMNAMGKAPLWISVVLLCVIELIHVLPLK